MGGLRGDRCQAENDGQERREEKHGCLVRLGCECTHKFEVIYILEQLPQRSTPHGFSRQRPMQALRAALTITDGCDGALTTDYIELVVGYRSIAKMIDQYILVLTMRYNLLQPLTEELQERVRRLQEREVVVVS